MKSFRTEFGILPSPKCINHEGKLLTVGSCFSEVIGEKLHLHKFRVLVNPFGILFNPISIFKLLLLALEKQSPEGNLYLTRHDKHYHFQFHSRISADHKVDLKDLLDHTLQQVNDCIRTSSHLMVTLGTAFVFRHLPSNSIVANCHKQPAKDFRKELLTFEEMILVFESFYQELKRHNPGIQIVLTVSPVRHIKDGIPQNQVSKGLLRVFCDLMEKRYEDVYYFPAYELQMDDLRDYRFYKDDLIHPNATAENYIWEKFKDAFFEQPTIDILHALDQVQKNLNHRPFEPLSESHFEFLKHLLQKMERMPAGLDFSEEKKGIMEQIKQIEDFRQTEKSNSGNESE
ncbi:GSCFA domain-containing protein [Cyclobacterium plantarum]|uniref:GSCFA domain-containing protein n=1 Tax=Cyclobacterium plantarum TaxID=2716263 RepID=A0ABX0H7I4_9BACT|nr:GSCFA domain-containing protein [Cyclobacterium plantarum]NHE57537.1 GSCFA domain-containing protein [Cyclobacterium plantarum]